MVTSIADWQRSRALERPADTRSPFGALLRDLRVAARLTQHQVAGRAKVDPAYVNRLERRPRPPARISRVVVVRLWVACDGEHDDLDRLLAAAGLLPESIILAGGWDAYLRMWRGQVVTLEHKLELRDAHIRSQARDLAARLEGLSP